MPLYSYRCTGCGKSEDRLVKLADFDVVQKCNNCFTSLTKLLAAPAVRGDYAGYTCPITDRWIEGKRAHQENLKRHGCRVLEPGETESAAKYRKSLDESLDKSVDETVDRFVSELPTDKKVQLFNEVASGLTTDITRS